MSENKELPEGLVEEVRRAMANGDLGDESVPYYYHEAKAALSVIAPYYEKQIAELKAQIPDWKFINENLIKLINETDIGTANAIAAHIYDTTPAEQNMAEIIRKQSEMLKMAKEALSHYKAIETMSNMRGDCPISNEATKALATIEEMEKL